ncbi:MAG: CHASE2 domain-containing protein, partial [Cyanobacteria bacterium J06642_11]
MGKQSNWNQLVDRLKASLWGLGIIAAVLGARSLGAFHALELMALDRFLTVSGQLRPEMTDPDITIVQIDPPYVDGSEDKGYTIEADTLASILEKIFSEEPTVVGTDILSYRILGDNQKTLLSTIERHPNLITVANYSANPAEPLAGLTPEQPTWLVSCSGVSPA